MSEDVKYRMNVTLNHDTREALEKLSRGQKTMSAVTRITRILTTARLDMME